MEKVTTADQTIEYGKAPSALGHALRNTVSSVTAGVGSVIPQQQFVVRPENIQDIASEDAFEKFKDFNTKTNLRANEKRMWGGLIDRIAGNVMFAAAAGIGVSGLATAGTPVGVAVFLGAVSVMVTSFFVFQQLSTREHSDKQMEVGDFENKRNAALIAQEIGKMLDEREGKSEASQSHSHTREVIVVNQPANDDKAPSTQLAAEGGRELQAKLLQFAQQNERA